MYVKNMLEDNNNFISTNKLFSSYTTSPPDDVVEIPSEIEEQKNKYDDYIGLVCVFLFVCLFFYIRENKNYKDLARHIK